MFRKLRDSPIFFKVTGRFCYTLYVLKFLKRKELWILCNNYLNQIHYRFGRVALTFSHFLRLSMPSSIMFCLFWVKGQKCANVHKKWTILFHDHPFHPQNWTMDLLFMNNRICNQLTNFTAFHPFSCGFHLYTAGPLCFFLVLPQCFWIISYNFCKIFYIYFISVCFLLQHLL